jgi:hypothetical protein
MRIAGIAGIAKIEVPKHLERYISSFPLLLYVSKVSSTPLKSSRLKVENPLHGAGIAS